MFREHIRAVIDRQCCLLRDETAALGRTLAQCDPLAGAAEAIDLSSVREACGRVLERAAAIGLDEVENRAHALAAALASLPERERIESWHMVEVMGLQGDLAAAVDELEPERSQLYADCTDDFALEIAPMPRQAFA